MKQSQDEEIVAGWLEPLGLPAMLAALREVGFSGDVYRGCFADLGASLDDDDAGALHFLRHGYAEGRIFRTDLDLAGLQQLRQLPMRNRFYLQNLVVALASAWAGFHVRNGHDLAARANTIERLCTMGAVPLLIIGDRSAELYRRGASRGDRWICPLAMAPFESIDDLVAAPPERLPAPHSSRTSRSQAIPTLWKFGQSDMQDGYLLHRLRHGVATDDQAAFLSFAAAAIDRYAACLSRAVGREARAAHWIAGLFPPVWQRPGSEAPFPLLLEEFGDALPEKLAEAGADSLPDRTAMHHAFNQLLEKAVTPLGFNLVQDFDSFLTAQGIVDEHFLKPLRNSSDLDYRSVGGILSTTLWSIAGTPVPPAAPSVRDQFVQLLEEIRMVQMGELNPPQAVPR